MSFPHSLFSDACSHSVKAFLILLPFSNTKMDMLVLRKMRPRCERWFIFPLDSICIILSINSKGMTRHVIVFWHRVGFISSNLAIPRQVVSSSGLLLQWPVRKACFSKELTLLRSDSCRRRSSVCTDCRGTRHSSSSDSWGRLRLNPTQNLQTGTSKKFSKEIP